MPLECKNMDAKGEVPGKGDCSVGSTNLSPDYLFTWREIMSSTHVKKLALVTVVILVVLASFGIQTSLKAQSPVLIGLITKTETNPFFVKMREGAQAAADKAGA